MLLSVVAMFPVDSVVKPGALLTDKCPGFVAMPIVHMVMFASQPQESLIVSANDIMG